MASHLIASHRVQEQGKLSRRGVVPRVSGKDFCANAVGFLLAALYFVYTAGWSFVGFRDSRKLAPEKGGKGRLAIWVLLWVSELVFRDGKERERHGNITGD